MQQTCDNGNLSLVHLWGVLLVFAVFVIVHSETWSWKKNNHVICNMHIYTYILRLDQLHLFIPHQKRDDSILSKNTNHLTTSNYHLCPPQMERFSPNCKSRSIPIMIQGSFATQDSYSIKHQDPFGTKQVHKGQSIISAKGKMIARYQWYQDIWCCI